MVFFLKPSEGYLHQSINPRYSPFKIKNFFESVDLENIFLTFHKGRAVIGMGLGIASMSIPIYLSECAPPSVRGKIITANNLSITAGKFLRSYNFILKLYFFENFRPDFICLIL